MNSTTQTTNFTEFQGNAGRMDNVGTFVVLSLVQIVTGSLFNGFVIMVLFINYRLLQVPAHFILLSLAISDFFACVVVLPYHVYLILHINETQLHHTLLLFSMTLSMAGTIALTVDRFLAVFYPLRYNVLVTMKRARYVVASCWVISILYSAFFYMALHYRIAGVRYLLLLVKCCAVVAIFLLYAVIFRAACRQIKQIKSQEGGDPRRASVVMFKKALSSAKSSGSIVFFFAATYLPVCVLAARNEYRALPISTYNDYVIWLLCLAFLNCSLNPLLYCMFSEKLRLMILGYWRRILPCPREDDVPTPPNASHASRPL
jgi:hypothetical protein